jgi:hypothetical protein
MYAKLIDGDLNIAPKKLPGDGTIVYNPPADMYLAEGYRPVTFTDAPEASEGYYYESGWEETEEAIVQTWTLTPLPDDIDEREAYGIIFGGAE